jgi:hypothetical protein
MRYKKMNFPYYRIILFCACVFLLLSCQKPMQYTPSSYLNLSELTITPLYYNALHDSVSAVLPSDTLVWQDKIAFKIGFQKLLTTWDPAYQGQVVIYNLYRKQANSDNQVVIGRSFGASPLLDSGKSYTYMDDLGKIDSIKFIDSNFIIDIINDRTSESFVYGIASVTGVQQNTDGVNFARGFVNKVQYASQGIVSKPPVFLFINNNAPYTATPQVTVTGRFDTTGVDTLRFYRYSYLLGGYSGGATEVIRKEDFSAYFDSFNVSSLGMAEFSKKTTLSGGAGFKGVQLIPVSRNPRARLWSPLSDSIAIAPYDASIGVDFNAAGVDYRINEFEKTICLFSDSIPVIFRTYGDTTFDSQVYIWLATRDLTSEFFDKNMQISGSKVTLSYRRADIDNADCILESPPQVFIKDIYGNAGGILSTNYEHDFRVSPLYTNDVKTVHTRTADTLRDTTIYPSTEYSVSGIDRSNTDPVGLALTVKPGSILGYDSTHLNAFAAESVFTIIGLKKSFIKSFGWHVESGDPVRRSDYFSRMRAAEKLDDVILGYLPENIYSFDSVQYINPMRHIPVHALTEAKKGAKEFVIIAYTKGKYFGEPRVFISTFSSSYKYVWDKIPPCITWSDNYDPFVNKIYAPLYYSSPGNDHITNLSQLGNIFDVWLNPQPSSIDKVIMAGMRDVGFGQIKSAVLHFHPVVLPSQYTADPLTGARRYNDGSEDREFPLDDAAIQSQALSLYMQGDGNYFTKRSYSIFQAVFPTIDASAWQSGLWEMWVETEDDLGNKGIAPYGGKDSKPNRALGAAISRQIEIK